MIVASCCLVLLLMTSASCISLPSRRAFVAVVPSIAASAVLPLPAPAASATSIPEIRAAISEALVKEPDMGPTLVRLAWHSSGTYSKLGADGGSGGGTIRFKEELAHGGNAGLSSTAIPFMEKIKKKAGDSISYADLYTLVGVEAISHMGGPDILWRAGRSDRGEDAVTPDGRLPNADTGPPGADKSDAAHLRQVFGRMGFDDRDIVALSGAHALGRCHTSASGFDGPWSPTPLIFNNAYFSLLAGLDWSKREWSGPFQYENGKGGSLMMLPSDVVLVEDKNFKKYVKLYAADKDLFFKDFSSAFQRLEELGCNNLA